VCGLWGEGMSFGARYRSPTRRRGNAVLRSSRSGMRLPKSRKRCLRWPSFGPGRLPRSGEVFWCVKANLLTLHSSPWSTSAAPFPPQAWSLDKGHGRIEQRRLWCEPTQLLDRARSHWAIENGQHYRRDRTQLEDRCPVRETNTAWVLSLFRSLTIFRFVAQPGPPTGQDSLPDSERKNHRNPSALIHRFMRPST